MFSLLAGFSFLEIIPIPGNNFTTVPILLQIMKHWLPRMVTANVFFLIFRFGKFFVTSFVITFKFAIRSYKNDLFLFFPWLFLRLTNFDRRSNLTSSRLLFFSCLLLIILYLVGLVKIRLVIFCFFLFGIAMLSFFTSFYLFELLPGVNYLVATSPSFF